MSTAKKKESVNTFFSSSRQLSSSREYRKTIISVVCAKTFFLPVVSQPKIVRLKPGVYFMLVFQGVLQGRGRPALQIFFARLVSHN